MINLPYAEVVPSETTEGAVYTVTIVDFTADSMACNCKDWEYRGSETHQCKHIKDVIVRLADREGLLVPRYCAECNGAGLVTFQGFSDASDHSSTYDCPACRGTGYAA